jgi:hypothetical protein
MSETRRPPTGPRLPTPTTPVTSAPIPAPIPTRQVATTSARPFNINPADRLKVSAPLASLLGGFAAKTTQERNPLQAYQDFKAEKLESKILDMSVQNIQKIDELTRIVGNQNTILKDIIKTVKTGG